MILSQIKVHHEDEWIFWEFLNFDVSLSKYSRRKLKIQCTNLSDTFLFELIFFISILKNELKNEDNGSIIFSLDISVNKIPINYFISGKIILQGSINFLTTILTLMNHFKSILGKNWRSTMQI